MVKPQPDPIAEMLPDLADFLQYGEITVGIHPSLGYVATATDEGNCLAMLQHRRSETLTQLLTRLDDAIELALTEDIFTDEINS